MNGNLKRMLCVLLTAALVGTSLPASSLTAFAAPTENGAQTDVPVTEETSDGITDSSGNTGGEQQPSTEEDSDLIGGTTDTPEAGTETGTEAGTEAGTETGTEGGTEAGTEAVDTEVPEDAEAETKEEVPEGTDLTLPEEKLEEEGLEDYLSLELFENYRYGDPDYDGNYVAGVDADGNEVPELYSDDLSEIIAMAEAGMDLSVFFAGSIFSGFELEDLQKMKEEGYTFAEVTYLYTNNREIPEWMTEALGRSGAGRMSTYSLRRAARSAGPTSLTANGVTQMSIDRLGVITTLGGSGNHGPVYRLTAKGDDGKNYGAFCAKYGGSYSRGYTYSPVSYGELGMTNYQYNLIRTVINTYYKATGQQDRDFAAAQLIIWYILQNMPDDTHYFDPDYAWVSGGMQEAAVKIGGPAYAEFIRRTILSYSNYINQWWDAGADDAALESVVFNPDHLPGVFAEIYFWRSPVSNAQYIITWDIGPLTPTTINKAEIPYIDNFYLEKEAQAKYHVELTKESIITNELLEGIQFEVVESEASGHDLDYNIYKGTSSSYGTDYPESTVSTFGQSITENDHVPYMDDDVQPSGGQHRTVITTDQNGYASTTFVHEHTFREFYSNCMDGNNALIDYDQYLQIWDKTLTLAEEMEATDPGAPIEVLYKGSMQEMTLEKIQEIYDSQQIVYTQPQADAQSTIDEMYAAYMDRTYTYTVTELDTYTRDADTDSNGKTMDTITLPKEGYRKDVTDTTTIGSYVKVLANGQTMTAGGRNDQDPNTNELNITDEPWQNQIFINKTDLESNNQILYDTAFDIYEYYQYRVTLQARERKIDIGALLQQFETQQRISLDYDTIESATLYVDNEGGANYLTQTLDTASVRAIPDGTPYEVSFTPTAAGEYTVKMSLTLNQSLSTNRTVTDVITNGQLVDVTDPAQTDPYPKTYALHKKVTKTLELEESGVDNLFNVVGGGTVSMSSTIGTGSRDTSEISGPLTYTYIDAEGHVHDLSAADDEANLDADISVIHGTVSYTFSYAEYEDTGYVFVTDDDVDYDVEGPSGMIVSSYSIDGTTYSISHHVGNYPADGSYDVTMSFPVSANDLSVANIDRSVPTDVNDYRTWGSDNYEIVRVTADIAKQMGWSDTTIGMYTVHRRSATDAYTGTTFASATDHATGEAFGYQEYGTLYYTQANLGHFAIVERTAPADGTKKGYLGNYSDRDDSKLTAESSQKNPDGDPYETPDNLSVVKMVHYVHLCKDTNQYATYMLVDGYKDYDAEKYTNFVTNLNNEANTPTEDGYDAVASYEQSGMRPSIALEKYTFDDPSQAKRDVLNEWWDNYMNQYLRNLSGIPTINRDSHKLDTYYALKLAMEYQLNFVGTTIHIDSFNDGLSAESEITYNGTYTDTKLNYNSYAAEQAEALNARHGFNNTEFMQVGDVTYDRADEEKDARYFRTEAFVNKEQGYSFIDERTYGYIRFTKYDAEAQRYVDGDLDAGYALGTDHGDADLDGAIYSLYVSESNSFNVSYYEGTLDGNLFWAQPIRDGGFRLIMDGDGQSANGFTDEGDNAYTDYPHAYISGGKLYLDYTNDASEFITVGSPQTKTYKGIQHPDGMYGGAKHNGWFAVLEEQQVFIDADEDGYGDSWTLQDVTLENGAKVASASIKDGEFTMDGLYLGNYYMAEEIRDSIVIHSTDNNDLETSEIRWLSFAPGYLAATDENGNPIHYDYSFPYEGQNVAGTIYDPEQVYLQKETGKVSNQQVIKGAGFQINKQETHNESGSSGNTQTDALEGAGFTVYLISELTLIKDGTIAPAFTVAEGHKLVYNNDLIALYDSASNFVGYQFTDAYIDANHPFEAKYGGADYDIRTANRIIYVKDRGYYYLDDILEGYKDRYYSNESQKWDFSGETAAIARMYEDSTSTINTINAAYAYQTNALNQGSPCEWYGPNGISDGWVPTGVRNEYVLSELFTNHYGNLRSPELPWGAYIVVETTTPVDLFTVDPMFVTVSDSSASKNRARSVTLTDASFVASLVMVKRDANSGQDVIQSGIRYRIYDYQNECYVRQHLYGPDGSLSLIAQDVFETDVRGRLDAVASLEKGRYRIEEIDGPTGFYNQYWDQGNENDELLGGIGTDAGVLTRKNLFKSYYGTVDFEVTTDRKYKASGIVSNGNLDYIYIGETYFNKEAVGKINILKTGEVLVGYDSTDRIEYADEYTDREDTSFNAWKASAKDRAVFNQVKAHYDLGTDETEYRTVTETITVDGIQPVDYLATDRNGMHIAAVYNGADGQMHTMNEGIVYDHGVYQIIDGERTYYPNVDTITLIPATFVSEDASGNEVLLTEETTSGGPVYKNEEGQVVTDPVILSGMRAYAKIVSMDGEEIYGAEDSFTLFTAADKILIIDYDLHRNVYEDAVLAAASHMSIYHVSGAEIMNTDYLVTEEGGVLTTEDGGVLTDNGDGTYTLAYTEAIFDPDCNYDYRVKFSDGSTLDVRFVTYGIYLSADGDLVKRLASGGYQKTDADGNVTTDADATLVLLGTDTGETFDFIYEERPLAGATYEITAAEDIHTQDGNGGMWFKEGDVVATVTTGNDGEIVSFAPAYRTGAALGGGSYDYTYYYPEEDGKGESLTGLKYYSGEEFATTGSIENYWIDSRMSAQDKALYGIPAYTDSTVYPNTYYNEETLRILRRINRGTGSAPVTATDYVTRLENEGALTSHSTGILTETDDGYRLTYTSVTDYDGANLTEASENYYLLEIPGGDTIEVRESANDFIVTSSLTAPYAAGDRVKRTAGGYVVEHTDSYEPGVSKGALTSGAYDLGYTHTVTYAGAWTQAQPDGTFKLFDNGGTEILTMKGGVLVTSGNAFVEETAAGYRVTDVRAEDMTDNSYVSAALTIRGAELTVKTDTMHLLWDDLNGVFVTDSGSKAELSPDLSQITVTTGSTVNTYQSFDLMIEYDLHYASKNDIVRVENDGTLGTVSIYLPLGKYNVREIATPYGFVINDQVQSVELTYADQIKGVVFNTSEPSVNWTEKTMKIWNSKGLSWFLGGINTIGEKVADLFETNFFTWGSYYHAEDPYYTDAQSFLSFYDLRVKAWSKEDVPTPDNRKAVISKQDMTTLTELPGASLQVTDATGQVVDSWISTDAPHIIVGLSDGTYTLTETTAPDGYDVAESITFTVTDGKVEGGTVVMYDAPLEKKVVIGKKDIASGDELSGARMVLTNEAGTVTESWTSGRHPKEFENLPDGEYTLTEITAPHGYERAESVTFEVKQGVVLGGTVTMYDRPDEDNVYISKQDLTTKEEIEGAKLRVTDAAGNIIDSWVSGTSAHVMTGLPDGTYTLTEIMAPQGYDRAESITFHVVGGKAVGGIVVMYDERSDEEGGPEGDRREESEENQWTLGVGIYKSDAATDASLGGAKFGLYTKNDIYNVDGKLLVEGDTLLATATTDDTGFANFAVDIALMSKYLDAGRTDPTLIHRTNVSYTYDDLVAGPDADTYYLVVAGCDSILLTYTGTDYVTEDGRHLSVDTGNHTVSYKVEQSIDGNTAINTGDYYIQEIVPPKGYLIDDTIYDVDFEYDNDRTMYIPVYAEHKNVQTEVTLTKEDITGSAEVPGNEISFYKIKDVNDVDADGRISHDEDNLLLLDRWVSGSGAHVVKGLELSNGEWPRLNNQEVRENIYVFRETNPAEGYVSAPDIEVKLLQIHDETGSWFDASGELYGYEVLTSHVACDQDYESGSLLIPNEHADDWIAAGLPESDWDYSQTIDGQTAARWLLVNENLVVFVKDGITQQTMDKVLKESDFEDLTFNTVYFAFGGDALDVSGFYPAKQVTARPESSKITYTKTWVSLEDIGVHMYDDVTRAVFSKNDLTTGEPVDRAHLEIRDAVTGALIDEWVTGDDGYDEDGKPLPHYLENVLDVNHPYILVEALAPTEDGYVTSNSVEFTLNDSGQIQKVYMMDDYTKLSISKTDITTGKEIEGAKLQIWSADAANNRIALIDEWITGEDGYDAEGYPLQHRIDYLPVGHYVLVETAAPAGFLVAEDVVFDIADTGLIQTVQMEDATTVLSIYKYKTGTTQFVSGARIAVYEIPAEYISYLTDDVRFEADGELVDPAADPEFVTNDSVLGETDLAAYLTGAAAAGTEHRESYTTFLSLDYSMVKDDLVSAGYTMTHVLPDTVVVSAGFDHDYTVMDGSEEAFTYRFTHTSAGDAVAVTFDPAYVNAPGRDAFHFRISMDADLSDEALTSGGTLRVRLSGAYTLLIPASEITEIASSVTEPALTIHLTDADLRATITSENGPVKVPGLTPGWYVAMERSAPSGYVLDTTPQVFQLLAATAEQALYFYNTPKRSGGSHGGGSSSPEPTPVTPQAPLIGKLTLKLNGGHFWNNVRTEDTGEDGSSILFTVDEKPHIPVLPIVLAVLLGTGLVGAGIFLIVRRKRRW